MTFGGGFASYRTQVLANVQLDKYNAWNPCSPGRCSTSSFGRTSELSARFRQSSGRMERLLIGPKWTQITAATLSRKWQVIDSPSDGRRPCRGRRLDSLLAKCAIFVCLKIGVQSRRKKGDVSEFANTCKCSKINGEPRNQLRSPYGHPLHFYKKQCNLPVEVNRVTDDERTHRSSPGHTGLAYP